VSGPSLTDAAVRFASALTFEAIPGEVVHAAKRCLVDGIGVELASMGEPVIAVLDRYIARVGGRAEVRALYAGERRMPAYLAALRNGTAGHAMDWDDTQLPASSDRLYGFLTHPTTAPLAAALALVDRGRVDGKRFLTAFLAGFEVQCKIAEAISADHARHGYQSTATIGTFGAAVCAAKIGRADRSGIAQAVGMAASMAGGIKANFGTMAKLVHVGRAAENGVVAADLVADGLSASETALDGDGGYLAAAGRGGNPERVVDHFGAPYSILNPGVSVKPYPSGVVTHQTMDAMADVMRVHELSADAIDNVEVLVGKNIAEPIRFAFARTPLEGKFCMPFLLTAMVLERRAGPAEFTDAFVLSPRVREFQSRVRMTVDPQIDARGYEKIRSRLVVRLRDGREIVHDVDERYRGGPERPFTDAELEAKFAACVEGKLNDTRAQAILDFIWHLESQPNASALLDLTNEKRGNA
jgi:2-methylcitrate dehydratase PrpD